MKRRVYIALVLSALLAQASPAIADTATPTPSPSPTSTLSPQEQFKVSLAAYQLEIKTYNQQLKSLSVTFNQAVVKANKDYKIALQTLKSADAKYQAQITYKNALQAAAVAFDAAKVALGPAPVMPTPPAKAPKKSSQPLKGKKN